MSTYPPDAVSSEAPRLSSPEVPVAAPSTLAEPPSNSPPAEKASRAAHLGRWLARFTFRFGALYLGFFLLGRVLGMIPGLGTLAGQYYRYARQFVPWFGREVLHLEQRVSLAASGSGDKLFDWVQVAGWLALAFAGACVWVWFDRKRKGDGVVGELVRIALRYSLGMTMVSYGISKVLHEQMPAPSMYRLLGTYGESSPMGLLWTFMGQSWAYSAVAGGLEMLGGLLLFFRRTTTLGSLILIVVMGNVLLMNLTFDVPVKLYSAHYLLFAVILAAPDMRRLMHVLVLHRPTTPPRFERAWPVGRAARLLVVVKALMVVWILWLVPVQRIWRWVEAPRPAKSEFYGIYEVESFVRSGTEVPPLLTDRSRWRRIGIDEQNRGVILLMNDARMGFRLRAGPGKEKLTFEFPSAGGARRTVFSFKRNTSGQLELAGNMNGSEVSIRLSRADDRKLLLRERGFRWISETPFNR